MYGSNWSQLAEEMSQLSQKEKTTCTKVLLVNFQGLNKCRGKVGDGFLFFFPTKNQTIEKSV